jgi:plasmid stabilization system protein ParE
MAGKPLIFHEAAVADYEAALDWYLKRSSSAAANFASEVNSAIAGIAAAPLQRPPGNHGIRKFTLARFPFVVFYREVSAVIPLVAIAHGHRRPGYWKDRL